MPPIFHITTHTAWAASEHSDSYRSESLTTEGFIHCSLSTQLERVLSTHFKHQTDLILLTIDPEQVKAEIRYENSHGDGEHFPHIYGPLNRDAVQSVQVLQREGDRWNLPPYQN